MGLLLGLQGAIGWIMVASGLQPGMVAVAPVKLTLHLSFAGLFFASVVAFATWLTPPRRVEPARAGRHGLAAAGADLRADRARRAGRRLARRLHLQHLAADGRRAGARRPRRCSRRAPFWENFVDNVALVQFNHRIGAYLLLALRALARGRRCAAPRPGSGGPGAPPRSPGMTLAQAVLGVVTLLLVVPLWAGLAHQALAFALLAMAVVHATRATGRSGGKRREPDKTTETAVRSGAAAGAALHPC